MAKTERKLLWQEKVSNFINEYNAIMACTPNLPIEKVSKKLNCSSRTVARMLAVSRHISDPKVAKSKTLNQAYGKVKDLYPAYQSENSETKDQITSITSQIFSNGERK